MIVARDFLLKKLVLISDQKIYLCKEKKQQYAKTHIRQLKLHKIIMRIT